MKNAIYSLLIVGLLTSCGNNSNVVTDELKEAKGGVYYGGIFRMNEVADIETLFPISISQVISDRTAKQVYEGLVKFSQNDLSIVPAIAEKWEKNADATQWTFSLRKGVKFHDDPCFEGGQGREVTAKDLKYIFDNLCTANVLNKQFGNTFRDRVVGANEYYQSTIDKKPLTEGVAGVKIIDDYTIQINLLHPFPGFLNILATSGCWVYPREAYEKYGNEMRVKCVGTGPFRVKSIKEGENVILERNPNYWAVDQFGNQLPYLNIIKISFIKEKKAELLEFKRGNLDMMYKLPTEMIASLLGELDHAKEGNKPFEIQIVPAMSTFLCGFQHQSDIFSKKEVRLAFNYAIDREKIVKYVLQGEGIPATYGFVPPAFTKYDSKKLQGYTFDVDKARKYMAKAGYPDGKGFPKITFQTNSDGGERNIQIAEVMQKMLKENLNIDIEIAVMPFTESQEAFESGKTLFWRYQWQADYPDPETFLTWLYGKHVPEKLSEKAYFNSVRYKSARFDSLFSAAVKEVDDKKRYDLYLMADQTAIDDGAILPLYYDEFYRLVQTNVKNFPSNSMEFRDLTAVYLEPKKGKGTPK